ncbi:uncharacterized protein LOC124885897 [Capsicum annuum]|uniref:uncharacterized protein LOC124885897 n=1 Tax=Capsicum annuum TaxID=4072 RepID=UPI001FB15647|nr:uncharacterized protein LOC124885897 [Capsicum annuum]
MKEEAYTSRGSVFQRLGTTGKSLAQKGLMENEKQGFLEGIDDKDINSIFLSRMKRKVVLSITTDDEFPDEDVLFTEELLPWTLLFDGSERRDGAGAGVVLISIEKLILPFSFVLGEICSNNTAEYQVLIVGPEMALDMKIPQLDIYGDSKLIINQLLGSYEVKKEDLLPYHQYAILFLKRFDKVFLNHVPREENRMADALANLATMLALRANESTKVQVCHRWVIPGCLDLQIDESHHTSV